VSEAKRFIRPLISITLIGASILGLLNVYADNADVVRQAESVACDSKADCTARLTRVDRSPLSQNFSFALSYEMQGGKKATGRPADRSIKCARAFVLLGEYSCGLATP
jgi:hypothetical protein